MSVSIPPPSKMRPFRPAPIACLIILLASCFACESNAVDNEPAAVSIQQVKAMLEKPEVVIIDVRKPRNWWRSTKKILNAVREDPFEVDKWADKYAKDKTLIFYCA